MSESRVWEPTKDRRIKKRGEFYWARFKKRGVTVHESLKTQSFEIAKRRVEQIESQILLGKDWRQAEELFEGAWAEFLSDKAQGIKTKIGRERTLYDYKIFGETYYLPNLKMVRVSEFGERHWEDLVEALRKQFPDVVYFFNMRKYLMGFLSWAKRKGKIATVPYLFDPDAKLRAQREAAGPGKAYTLEELAKLREAALGSCHHGFHTFVLMAQFMGMRPAEIMRLRRDRIDLEKGLIALRKADTKTHKARLVPIHPKVRDALLIQIGAAGDSPYLFPNKRGGGSRPMHVNGFNKHWATALTECSLEGRVYDFRHTYITHALQSGMNPVVVAELTGTSIAMIQKHYLHLQPQDLATEIEKVTLEHESRSVVVKKCTEEVLEEEKSETST